MPEMCKNNHSTSNLEYSTKNKLPTLGFGQILVGIIIIIVSTITAWLSIKVLGLAIAVWGAFDVLHILNVKRGNRVNWGRSIPGWISLGIGIFLMISPGIGVAALSLILATLFILGGLYKILDAAGSKTENWGLEMSGGGLSVLLGLFIFSQWPVENVILLGILIGIEIILNGWSLMITGYALRTIHYNKPGNLRRE